MSEKVVGSLEYWKNETEDKETIPLSLTDFDTLEIYSLQEHYRSCFIRDYCIEMEFSVGHFVCLKSIHNVE